MHWIKFFTISSIAIVGVTDGLTFSRSVNDNIISPAQEKAEVIFSFGHTSSSRNTRWVRLTNGSPNVAVSSVTGKQLEKGDRVHTSSSILICGAGDIDKIKTEIYYSKPVAPLRKLAAHKDAYTIKDDAMWGYLMENGSPGQSERLKDDSWFRPDAPLLTVQLNNDSTRGFTIALEQLQKHGAMWLPEHDVYITLADKPVGFNQHLTSLKGRRVLDDIARQPDATLKSFQEIWPDIGNPIKWDKSWQTRWMGTLGHLTITAAAHGSIYKFAIDRWGNVRPDFASPHKFRLDFNWPESNWKRQKISNGLPVMITSLEKNGQHASIEQFASPLTERSIAIRGYLPTVFFSKVNLSGKPGPFSFDISFDNELTGGEIEAINIADRWIISNRNKDCVYLVIESGKDLTVSAKSAVQQSKGHQISITVSGVLSEGENKSFMTRLLSPAMPVQELTRVNNLDFDTEKNKITGYWKEWLSRGATFFVPEQEVNDLYRASLWHALILPRHTLDMDGKPHMDLPYANTAYGQRNADWPINQAVYVDYMIYGLRGYDSVAYAEYAAMFKSQQQPDGRIGGFANWGVYSPGQLYAIAQNYLLSGQKELFAQLLPEALKTLDWCVSQVKKAGAGNGKSGLILAPLNDLTNAEREWAFTQAYYVGGLELFAKALALHKHPRAEETAQAAAELKASVVKKFSMSSVKSPVVQLADGTWINFVPTDALTSRRMLEQWYPTDVDCGPLHLSRLGVFDANSWLTTAMLHDHEDNLFFKNQGAANEPVYVQQASAYLQRDDAKAVIRSFYSMMACGFSHEQYTSLEHRWAWGQYYGPPSTDGAWIEIYRKMLLNEWGNDTLIIGQAIPHEWLKEGKKIEVKNAPTYFGKVSFIIKGLSRANTINATVETPDRNPPAVLLVRFRHPDGEQIRSVTVNGKPWKHFDRKKEFIRIPSPSGKYEITAMY